jgi:arabinofuranan 3-O-arabinosyltransferase
MGTSTLRPAGTVGLAEVGVPGVTVSRTSTLAPATGAAVLELEARSGERSACVSRGPTNCLPSLARPGEESAGIDRTVTTEGITGVVRVSAYPVPGSALDALLGPKGEAARASASSTWVRDPAVRPQAAIDGDPTTAWVAATGDVHPRLTIELPDEVRVSRLRIRQSLSLAASRPVVLDVTVGSSTYRVSADERGYLRFPATSTRRIALEVVQSVPVRSIASGTSVQTVLPPGISELDLGEAQAAKQEIPRGRDVEMPCGSGPEVRAGNKVVTTSVSTTVGAVLDGTPALATSCGTAALPAGTTRVVAAPSVAFRPVRLLWSAPDEVTPVEQAAVTSWSADRRTVRVSVADHARTLELGENSSTGWEATLDGRALAPVRVDGWRQAFIVPAGVGGEVTVTFAPDTLYRLGLAVGLLAALVLVVLAALPGRPRRDDVAAAHPPIGLRGRLVVAAAVGAVCLGVVGLIAAPAAVALGDRRRGRPGVVSVLVIVATAGSVLAPWPAAAAWTGWLASASAVLVSACVAGVLGLLLARGARVSGGAPIVEQGAPRAGT